MSFWTLREQSFERLNYTAYILSALQCIRRKHQRRAAQWISCRRLHIENYVPQEFLMNSFMVKAFLKYSLRVHPKFLLIIGRFSRLRGNYLINNAFHCANNNLFRHNINLWSLIYIPRRLTHFKFIFASSQRKLCNGGKIFEKKQMFKTMF